MKEKEYSIIHRFRQRMAMFLFSKAFWLREYFNQVFKIRKERFASRRKKDNESDKRYFN